MPETRGGDRADRQTDKDRELNRECSGGVAFRVFLNDEKDWK